MFITRCILYGTWIALQAIMFFFLWICTCIKIKILWSFFQLIFASSFSYWLCTKKSIYLIHIWLWFLEGETLWNAISFLYNRTSQKTFGVCFKQSDNTLVLNYNTILFWKGVVGGLYTLIRWDVSIKVANEVVKRAFSCRATFRKINHWKAANYFRWFFWVSVFESFFNLATRILQLFFLQIHICVKVQLFTNKYWF